MTNSSLPSLPSERRRLHAFPGTCRSCLRKRDVYAIRRSGGGTYRRGGRSYASSLCGECAVGMLQHCGVHAAATHHGFSVTRIVDIAIEVDTDEARAAVAEFETRRDEDRKRRDAWRAERAAIVAAQATRQA